MKLWKIFRTFLMLIAFGFQLSAQSSSRDISWTQSTKKISDKEVELIFSAKIGPGWHLYGTDLAEGGPTATHLLIDKLEGGKLIGKLKGDRLPISKQDPFFEMQISYWEGAITLRQRISVDNADAFFIEGALRYMICDDQRCMPPTSEEFKYTAKDVGIVSKTLAPMAESKEQPNVGVSTTVPPTEVDSSLVAVEELMPPMVVADTADTSKIDLWAPVIKELKSFDGNLADNSPWMIFFYGFLGGFIALLTPCVWPMIPMTVSFFLKRTKDKKKAIRDALVYGLSIVVIYLTLGLLITAIFGAGGLNKFATRADVNVAFFVVLVVFAISFFGAFELVLPASWTNKMDQKADTTGGYLSILFMAFTLALVSFSCTGPIIGTLLVQASSMGDLLGPAIGMLGFSVALALPFALFAIFPSMLQSMPKSGGWLNSVKVVLAFLELALALKFLSVADLTSGWGILDREVFLVLWIVIFALLGFYLLGKIRFPHDSPSAHTSILGLFLGIISLSFSLYMVPGLWGAPLRAISAFAPPATTQDFNLYNGNVHAQFNDYEAGMAYAKQVGKPVLIDFSGYGCVNCRKMEASVWTNAEVKYILENDYVLITLMVDDDTKLSEPLEVTEHGKTIKLRTIGDKWSYFQRSKFGVAAQPFYVVLNNEGKPLIGSRAYDEDVPAYISWLKSGLQAFGGK